MSRIDELISELCPEGVPFRAVGRSVRAVATGRGVQRSEYNRGSAIPIVDQGQTRIAGHTDDESAALPKDYYIVFGDHTRALKWVDFRFAPGADGTKVLQAGVDCLPKFAYYSLTNLDIPSRGYNRHWAMLRDMRIPVPPLDVQHEIVRILDTFTELEAELKAELKARQRQYEHYRDSLMNQIANVAVRKARLGEFGTIFGGLTGKSKADFSEGNARFISYVNIFTNIAARVNDDDFVRVRPGEQQRALQRGDVLFTGSSETPDEVCMSSVVTDHVEEQVYLNSFSIGFRSSDPNLFDPEFTKHLYRSIGIREQLIRTASGVTRFNVSKARLARVEVPIPELSEQKRIARVLDKLYALVNDLSVGLPAELAARRKQYDYYRDRLLTFKELAV